MACPAKQANAKFALNESMAALAAFLFPAFVEEFYSCIPIME
jgi:hypothetical protein